MNIPDVLDSNGNECLKLKKTIYGLIQSAREFYKRLIEVLNGVGLLKISLIRVCCRNRKMAK
jgi:hypothetical protein